MRPGQHKNQNTFSGFLLVVGGHCYICMYSRRHDNSKKLFDIKKRNTVRLAGHFSIISVQPSQPHHIAYKTIFFFRHGMAIKQFYFFSMVQKSLVSFLAWCYAIFLLAGWILVVGIERKLLCKNFPSI